MGVIDTKKKLAAGLEACLMTKMPALQMRTGLLEVRGCDDEFSAV